MGVGKEGVVRAENWFKRCVFKTYIADMWNHTIDLNLPLVVSWFRS